ncbi:hypothetical protein B484DRAFT_446535, partial [Ochromonadaceae sp. CCMP2298]
RHSLAVIPCYGGLPPNGSTHDSDSLGSGNSRADRASKLQQCMASACASLRYFGHVFLGVVREEDRLALVAMLRQPSPGMQLLRGRVSLVQFTASRPIVLIFQLLVFAQHYVRLHNCLRFTRRGGTGSITSTTGSSSSIGTGTGKTGAWGVQGVQGGQGGRRLGKAKGWWKGKLKKLLFDEDSLPLRPDYRQQIDRLIAERNRSVGVGVNVGGDDSFLFAEAFEVCSPQSVSHSFWAEDALNVTRTSLSRPPGHTYGAGTGAAAEWRGGREGGGGGTDTEKGGSLAYSHISGVRVYPYSASPLSLVFFTEADQLVRFHSPQVKRAIAAANNGTAYILGTRRAKGGRSDPSKYMDKLDTGRLCGDTPSVMDWPASRHIWEVPKTPPTRPL